MRTLELAPDIVPLPGGHEGDDDLIHDVCDYCDRALCDGGVCYGVALDHGHPGLMCVVCVEMAPMFQGPCPYCDNEGPSQ